VDAHDIEIKEKVSASRKLGRDDAAEIAKKAKRLVIARGRKLTVFSPGGKPDEAMITGMLGSTGNLRAPTLKIGSTVLVGFNEDEYASALL